MRNQSNQRRSHDNIVSRRFLGKVKVQAAGKLNDIKIVGEIKLPMGIIPLESKPFR